MVPFPALKPGTLFEIADKADQAAHDRTMQLIETIIAAAPRRFDEANPTKRAKDLKVHIVPCKKFPISPPLTPMTELGFTLKPVYCHLSSQIV